MNVNRLADATTALDSTESFNVARAPHPNSKPGDQGDYPRYSPELIEMSDESLCSPLSTRFACNVLIKSHQDVATFVVNQGMSAFFVPSF